MERKADKPQGIQKTLEINSTNRTKRPYRKKASASDPTKGMGINEKKLKEVCSLHTKLVRNIVGLSRQQLAEKINMSPQIVRVWEDMHAGTVSDKGARKIKEQLEEMGVAVDEKWLMYGTGCMPIITYKYYQSQGLDITLDEYRKLLSEDAVIQQEIQLFELNVKDAVIMQVADNSNEPFSFAGDTLGGIIEHQADKLRALLKRYCIVKTKEGELLCRKLMDIRDQHHVDVCVINPAAKRGGEIQENVEVEFVARLVRYWGRQ